MRISINTSKWYSGFWAALLFFTRLPFWRIYQPPKEAYQSVVEYWPLTGWLTAGVMASIIYFGSMVFPFSIALILAWLARLLLTGALHEDGLVDFFDGVGGGGNNRQRILDIMKDSHMGTFGLLALIVYTGLLFSTLYILGPFYAALAVLAADPFSKMIAAQITQLLPYTRTEEQSKAHNLYRRFTVGAGISLFAQGTLPMLPLVLTYLSIPQLSLRWDLLIFMPCLVMFALYMLMVQRLRGYTGDCCGAVFLLVELSFYLTMSALVYIPM